MAFLRLSGDREGNQSPLWLRRRITTIGAADDSDLRLPGDAVADHHATITCEGPQFTIRPAHRSAPVEVNGRKVRRKHTLEEGDEIRLGDLTLSFHHLIGQAPDSSSAMKDNDRRRLKGLAKIHELSLELLAKAELDVLLDGLVDASIELTGADKGFLLLVDDHDRWHLEVARNFDAQKLGDEESRLSDSVVRRVIETKQPLIIADAGDDADFRDAQSVINLEVSSVLCLPLMERGTLQGVLYVGNDRVTGLFDEIHLELISIFAAQLGLLIANARFVDELRRDRRELQKRLRNRRFGSLIGASDAMEPIFHGIERVAATDVTVLITGETGTGKELVAQELHRRSQRVGRPFVTLNCGAIPAELLESELFGHVRGAFTGATAKKDGQFHAADGGTIFLDEVGEMPLQLQVKLLRVLQERSFTRVGSNKTESVDIRVLAATNRDLQQRVEDGQFREDLYYRLNVIELILPPLRDRGDDVVLIAEFLVDQIADELGTPAKPLSAKSKQALRRYHWPGNVRQLENRLKKGLVLARGDRLQPQDLDLFEDAPSNLQPLAEAKEQFALEYILEVLEKNDGNRSQTARDLEVDPRTIFRYLEKASEEKEEA